MFLLGLAIPLQATIIPIYYMIIKLQLYDTLLALILPSIAFAIPLSASSSWRTSSETFPTSCSSRCASTGRATGKPCGDWPFPLVRPALVTVAIYDALNVWNGFLFPLILTQSPNKRVLPLALWTFQGQFTVNIPAVLAAVVLSTLPILVLYILGRRQLVSGLTAGFSK